MADSARTATSPKSSPDRLLHESVSSNRHSGQHSLDGRLAELVRPCAQLTPSEGRLLVIQLEWNGLTEALFGDSPSQLAVLLLSFGYQFYRPDEQGEFK